MSKQQLSPETLYTAIAEVIQQARQQVRQAVNQQMVQTYWQVGRLIVEQEQQGQERAEYGKQQLKQLSERLRSEFGKGFDVTNLRNMRRFYLAFPIRDALRLELSWTHYRSLLRIESPSAQQWYANEAAAQNWSARALERQIGTLYYERLLASKDKAVIEQEAQDKTEPLQDDPKHYLRDPYILDFLNLQDKTWQESDLEQGIISNLQQFLLELGKCFLLIDLKMHKLTHQDVGQMDMYVRMYEEQKRRPDDNPTIGLILCSERNNTVAKYSVLSESKQLFASKYLTALPTEEELARELERERERVLRLQEAAARYESDT